VGQYSAESPWYYRAKIIVPASHVIKMMTMNGVFWGIFLTFFVSGKKSEKKFMEK